MTFHQCKVTVFKSFKILIGSKGELLKDTRILLPKLSKMPSGRHKQTTQKEVTEKENILRALFHLYLKLTLLIIRKRRDEAS